MEEDGTESSYLSHYENLANGLYSNCLSDFIEKWSNELSYRKMSELLEEVSGSPCLSAGGVKSYLSGKAARISEEWLGQSLEESMDSVIEVSQSIDLYDSESKECLLLIDDVGVKAQKPHKNEERREEDAKRHDTAVVLLEDQKGKFHYLCEGIDKEGSLIYPIERAIRDKIRSIHMDSIAPSIVAITDGARSIRLKLQSLFRNCPIILDWYHLQHKIDALMSMIVANKMAKEAYVNELKSFLWEGRWEQAIAYLETMEGIKNPIKKKELREYIQKHRTEIINYKKRQENGKCIGSGRGEKANDLIVAHRQKKKGMAWSKKGSKSLAIIKVYRLNK